MRRPSKLVLALGALLLAGAISVALAVPRMHRHDYSRTRLWQVVDGRYIPGERVHEAHLDTAGVPLRPLAGTGLVYNPLAIAQYARAASQNLSDPNSRRAFWASVEWLRRNARVDPKRGVLWEYHFDWPINEQKSPWVSAMSQGACLTVLARAFQLSGDSAYLKLAKGALRSFEINEDDGGVTLFMDEGVRVYQDFPGGPYVVTDGWLNSLASLHEFYRMTGDPQAKRLLDDGLRSLKRLLPQFYGPVSVYYSSRRDLPDPAIFAMSLNSLRYLSAYDPALRPTVAEWQRMVPSGFWTKYVRVYYQALNWRLLPFRRTANPVL